MLRLVEGRGAPRPGPLGVDILRGGDRPRERLEKLATPAPPWGASEVLPCCRSRRCTAPSATRRAKLEAAGRVRSPQSGRGDGYHVWVARPADLTAAVSAMFVVAATAGGMGVTAGRVLRPLARDGAARAREQLTRRGGAARACDCLGGAGASALDCQV